MKHCTHTLRSLLSPNYTVVPVLPKLLRDEPWPEHTALLVFPGGADLPYCRELNGTTNSRIKKYVEQGGRYLGFCAGGYYGSGNVEFEMNNVTMQVEGARELAFFKGIARGSVYKGFEYGSETCAVAAKVSPERGVGLDEDLDDDFCVYFNGGCLFVDAECEEYAEDVTVLCTYTDDIDVDYTNKNSAARPASVVYCRVGDGCAVLSGIHPEFSPDFLRPLPKFPEYQQTLDLLKKGNSQRVKFLKSVLEKMGLKVCKEPMPIPSLSRLFLSGLHRDKIPFLVSALLAAFSKEDEQVIQGTTDAFHIYDSSESLFKNSTPRVNTPNVHNVDVFYHDYPTYRATSHFNHDAYYQSLSQFYYRLNSKEEIGSFLLYGEVVKSTFSILSENFNILRLLPHGFSVVGSIQTEGRGRGNNVWLNPPGVLAVSTVLHISRDLVTNPVILQYLVTLAMIESIKNYGLGYSDMPVRIKWPNDIYIKDFDTNDFLKIGGSLITTNVVDHEYIIIAGLGLNVSNLKGPSTSLNRVLSRLNKLREQRGIMTPLQPYSIERLLAKYFVTLETMLNEYQYQGFKPFEKLFYSRWLHTGKTVKIDTAANHRRKHDKNSEEEKTFIFGKIRGISLETGMMMVEEYLEDDPSHTMNFERLDERSKWIEVFPDGNSFDLLEGLIRLKI